MRLVLLILFTIIPLSISAENSVNSPKHHLSNGTYTNTSGIANESSLKEVLKWSWERRGKKLETFEFETKKPNYQKIHKNEDLTITWIGHESFLYQNKDINILTDPHFSERASPLSFAGPKRYMAPGMKIDDLPDIDVVTISHSHYDHLDYSTVKSLSEKFKNILFIVPLGLQKWFEGKGIYNVIELDWWDSIKVQQTVITFAPVQHWSARGIFDRNESLWGAWYFKNVFHSFLHLGDTGYTEDFKEIRKKLGPVDLAAIPIGAYEPRWIMEFSHLNPEEAVLAYFDLDATKAIGMSWGTFILTDEPVTEPPKKLNEALQRYDLSKEDFFVLAHGETYLID